MEVGRSAGDKVEVEPDPATWSALEEKFFVLLMIKEVNKGNRSRTTFTRKGWENIEQEFYDKTRKRYSYSQFRNKFNQLRTRYDEFSKLLKAPGFTWDSVLGNITATDDVWESYIKVNKYAKRFRTKGCPIFDELSVLFSDPLAKCKDVLPLAQYPIFTEEKLNLEDESTNATPTVHLSDKSKGKDCPSQSAGRKRHRSPTPTSHLQGKRDAKIDVAGEALNEQLEAPAPFGTSNTRTETVGKVLPMNMYAANLQPSPFSITNCIKCLESIEGVDASKYLKAIKMFKDVDWREMFMAMSAERRLVWLASLE